MRFPAFVEFFHRLITLVGYHNHTQHTAGTHTAGFFASNVRQYAQLWCIIAHVYYTRIDYNPQPGNTRAILTHLIVSEFLVSGGAAPTSGDLYYRDLFF